MLFCVLFFVLFTPLKSCCSLLQLFLSKHFFNTSLLINTLSQISSKKNKSIYTISIYFQPENIRSLCQAVPNVVYDFGLVVTDVHRESINICTKYSLLLNKFAEFQEMLNGNIEFDDERIEGFSKL